MHRPLRNTVESITEKVPNGPLGFLGRGNGVGALGFATVGLARKLTPISGVNIGYKIVSQEVRREDGIETHTFEINSASKDVARFVAKINSSPSTIDFAIRETDIKSIRPLVERSTFNTWEVVVEVEDRAAVEDIEGERITHGTTEIQ